MRTSLGIILLAALVLGAGGAAADPPVLGGPGGTAAAAGGEADGATNGPCVDVQVGNERVPDYACINRQLRTQAEHAHTVAPLAAPPVDIRSSVTVGTANTAAAQQMLGNAFGKSAQPQRPAPPAFVPALPHAGAH